MVPVVYWVLYLLSLARPYLDCSSCSCSSDTSLTLVSHEPTVEEAGMCMPWWTMLSLWDRTTIGQSVPFVAAGELCKWYLSHIESYFIISGKTTPNFYQELEFSSKAVLPPRGLYLHSMASHASFYNHYLEACLVLSLSLYSYITDTYSYIHIISRRTGIMSAH